MLWETVSFDIDGSTVSDNSAGVSGGGIAADLDAQFSVMASTISANIAATGGGGLIIRDGSATLTNAIISGNSAAGFGGGLGVEGDQVTLSHVTVAGNSAPSGAGVSTTSSTLIMANSIVAGGVGGVGGTDCVDLGSSSVIDLGGMLVETDSNCGTFDIEGVPAQLGPLANYGGGTPTHALLTGSPAIGAGIDFFCQDVDQRGIERQRPCDIGAFEIDRGICFAVKDKNGGTVMFCL